MIKRCVSYFLALTFIFVYVGDLAVGAVNNRNEFNVVKSVDYPEYNATLTLYEHKKTGALISHWKNSDFHKAFQISFRTPTYDNTGVNHVLEHCLCSGSKKYPDNSLLFTAMNQTCNTFINAATFEDKTSYYAASLSGKQLMGLLDVFMDSIFHPLVEEDKMIFERESYRLELRNDDDEITETGTVYNEMQQVYSNISNMSSLNAIKNLYPDSNYSYVPGGEPSGIKELTYEHLMETWEKYYHPSNMYISMYGDINADEFLQYIDKNYLCNYSRKEIEISNLGIDTNVGVRWNEYDFPVEADKNVGNGSIERISYSIDNENISVSNLEALTKAFNNEGSYFRQLIKKEFPNLTVYVNLFNYGQKNIFEFFVQEISKSDFKKFESLVKKAINNAAKYGFSEDIVKNFDKNTISALCEKQIEKRSMRFGSGISIITILSDAWAKGKDIFSVFKDDNEIINNDKLKDTVNQALVNNLHKAVTITTPKSGLSEENRKKIQQELKDKKSQMSENDVKNLIERSKKFAEWTNKTSTEDVRKKLQLINIDDLTIKVPENKAVREIIDGMEVISVASDDEFLYYSNLIFDISELSEEEYYIANLLATFIGNVDTVSHSKSDLDNIMAKQIFAPAVFPLSFNKDGSNRMGILCSWMGKSDNYLADCDLMREYVLGIDLHDYDNMKSAVAKLKSYGEISIANQACSEMVTRGKYFSNSSDSQLQRRFNMKFYDFIKKFENELKTNPEQVISKLEKVRKLVFNKKSVILGLEGKQEFINDSKQQWVNILNRDLYNPSERPELTETQKFGQSPDVKQREAFNNGANVQVNGMVSFLGDMNFENFESSYVLACILSDKYLIPNVRHKLGAYFCQILFDREYMILLSGRDPGVSKTFEAFSKIPEFIRNMEITQEELDQYIIKTYFDFIYLNTTYNTSNMIFDTLKGVTKEQKIKLLSNVKNTKVSDIKMWADVLEKLIEKAYKFTVGSNKAIQESKEQFDKILSVNS